MHDLCVIVVSYNGQPWLDTALGSLYEHAGELELDVVVVDNGEDGAHAYVEQRFPQARTLRCENGGFGHANNRGLETADARYVLFLNPDTEFLEGSLAEMVSALDRRPEVGLAGARQLNGSGALSPSIRRFPSATNMLAEALAVERFPGLRRLFGERELDQRLYARETPCDWTSGSFMLARREALEASGGFDERFFLFAEETDLCLRVKQAGWDVAHLPTVTIRHYEHERRDDGRMEAQAVYARLQFARKHFDRVGPYRWALALRYALRAAMYALRDGRHSPREQAALTALRTVLHERPPFGRAGVPAA